jgi:hypothetical protein
MKLQRYPHMASDVTLDIQVGRVEGERSSRRINGMEILETSAMSWTYPPQHTGMDGSRARVNVGRDVSGLFTFTLTAGPPGGLAPYSQRAAIVTTGGLTAQGTGESLTAIDPPPLLWAKAHTKEPT